MKYSLARGVVLAIATAVAVACLDDSPVLTTQPSPLARVGHAPTTADFWTAMSDSTLAAFLDSAGNRVFIGFKLPGQRRGVSERGERLISRVQEEAFKSQVRGLGVRIEREYDLPAILAELPRGLLRQVRALPFIDYVEPIVRFQPDAQDTTLEVRRVGTHLAWPITDGVGVKILIIDSGRDPNHEDLAGVESRTCVGGTAWDQTGHGTEVLGIVAARNNTVGMIGGAYGANVVTIRVGDADYGTEAIVCALRWGRDNGVRIFNLSFSSSYYQSAMADQISAAFNEGRLIVASAGNEGGAVRFPANIESAIAVSGTTIDDGWAGLNSGPEVELTAPAMGVRSTWGGDACYRDAAAPSYGWCYGNSFAVPQVAYAAALVWSHSPSLTNAQVRSRLQESAVDLGEPGRDPRFGFGRLNVAAALGNTGQNPMSAVTISGPDCIYGAGDYLYEASASGGTAPHRFEWYRAFPPGFNTWTFDGEGSSRYLYFPPGSYSLQLKVRAADSQGLILEAIKWVQVHTGSNVAALLAGVSGNRPDAKMCARGEGGGGADP